MDEKINILREYNLWDGNVLDVGFQRSNYTDRLAKLTGNRLVKVLIGQRHVGKSILLSLSKPKKNMP